MAGLQCDGNASRPWLPVCVNTSFPGYAGSWSMVSSPPLGASPRNATVAPSPAGMRTATAFDPATFGRFVFPNNIWTLEVAFPIRGGPHHGGLLDANVNEPSLQREYLQYDPNNNSSTAGTGARRGHDRRAGVGGSTGAEDAAAGEVAGAISPTYWWIDFARTEHPREYLPNINTAAAGHLRDNTALPLGARAGVDSDLGAIVCPLNCSSDLAAASPVLFNPGPQTCARAQAAWPTLLGTDPTYGCYWEYVWQDLGADAYMHRPTAWAMLQFADGPGVAAPCLNIEFPARHIAKQIHLAQLAYLAAAGAYAVNAAALADARYCAPPACALADLRQAIALTDTFAFNITVQVDAAALSRECTARPCYTAAVTLTVPPSGASGFGQAGASAVPARASARAGGVITARINENRWLRVEKTIGSAVCL